MVDIKLAQQMLARFEGYDKAYGSYDPNAARSDLRGGKVEIKSTAFTKRALVTAVLWLDHLLGKQPLGVIPIRDNNTCLWGCIDIDQYGVDIVELIARIAEFKLPLIVCGSKSGGAHIFLFMKAPIEAALMQIHLREIAAILSYGSSEIFPKQNKMYLENGDVGNWLNMPYFGQTRMAYKPDGTTMTLIEFLIAADGLAQKADWFEDYGKSGKANKKQMDGGGSKDFRDGPPCMQHLAAVGISEGGRNKGTFAFGIYAKKKYGANWQEVLEQWNRDINEPPLPATELVGIIQQLEKKDYFYPCKEQPIVAHCNSALCRTRKFGVGGSANELPVINGISKVMSDPPMYFLDVGVDRIQLSLDQLINYKSFQKACYGKFDIMFMGMKQTDWEKVLADAEVNRIEESEEVGHSGQFIELLEDFLIDKHRCEQKEDIVTGKPWLDDTAESVLKHKFYFRLRDLQKFLEDSNFTVYLRGEIAVQIRELGGNNHGFNFESGFVRVWWLPKNFTAATRRGKINIPPLDEDII